MSVFLLSNPLVCSNMLAVDFRNLKVDLERNPLIAEFHDAVEFARRAKEAELYPTGTLWGAAMGNPVSMPDCDLLVVLGGCGTDVLRQRAAAQLKNGRRVLTLLPSTASDTHFNLEHEFCVFAEYASVGDVVRIVEVHIREVFFNNHNDLGQGRLFPEEDALPRTCCGRCGNRCATEGKNGGSRQVRVSITTNIA